MSTIYTTAKLAGYMGTTLSAAETTQATFAIDEAIAIVSRIVGYNVDPIVIASGSAPSELSAISSGSCGTIGTGKWKKFSLATGSTIFIDPATAIRKVILAPRGVDFTGKNTCTAGLTFPASYQLSNSFNGDQNVGYYNMISLVTYFEYCGCTISDSMVFVEADFGWPSDVPPAGLEAVVYAVAQDAFSQMTNNGLKQESIDGHSYTFAEDVEATEKYKKLLSRFSASTFNYL